MIILPRYTDTTKIKDIKDNPEYISESQLSRLLNVSRTALAHLRVKGKGPPHYRLSHTLIRYKLSDVYKFMEDKKKLT